MTRFNGVIFDLDGTLLDSMKVWENVDKDFLTRNGAVYTPEVSDTVKRMTVIQSAEYFRTNFCPHLTCDEIISRVEEMVSEQYRCSIPLKKGAADTVKRLYDMGIRLCVATATYNSLAYAALKRLKILDMLEFVLTCQDVNAGKDDPVIFTASAEKLGLDINEVLVVEDSLHCIETAKKAGFYTAAVYDPIAANEWELICSTADAAFMEIGELFKLL